MTEIRIGEMIKGLRMARGISQETLANVCGVSMQAVSKWENEQSCPDITFLPLLAEYFEVSIDYLLTGKKNGQENVYDSVDDNLVSQLEKECKKDILYIIQYRNGKILDKKQWIREYQENKDDVIRIEFDEEFENQKTELQIEIWGDASIEAPDTGMNLSAGGYVHCGTVLGNIEAGASVYCDEVGGNVSAGGDVNCDGIGGNVSAGNNVDCDGIGGNVAAGNNVNCDGIGGSVSAGNNVNCDDIWGDISAGQTISCETVKGNVKDGIKIEYR